MMRTTIEKAAGAINSNGLHTDTISVDFPTIENNSKAISTQIAELALAGRAVHAGGIGDFTVCKYGMTRYCEDFAELQAFARRLGVKK